jgi:membrane protease YdiL (CAAX protease family)
MRRPPGPSTGDDVRVKPTALRALLAILGYLVVVFSVWAATDLQYDEVGDTVANVQKGVTLAIGLGAVYLIVVTTALGWWRPALLFVGAVLNIASTKWGEIADVGRYTLWLAVGCAFVGFSEELLTRGLAIVGGRGSMHERWVWVFSGVIFGALHLPNAFFGQSVGSTAVQMVFAFLVGMTYYVTRRITGTLVVTMVLHALWDFGTFVYGHSVDKLADKPTAYGGMLLYVAIALGVVALIQILKTGDVVAPAGDELEVLDDAASGGSVSATPERTTVAGAEPRGSGPRT